MRTKHITAKGLINLMPAEFLEQLAQEHEVDYQVKKLYGERIFKLLIYGLLSGKELSLRILENLIDRPYFKHFAAVPQDFESDHSSLAERLGHIKVSYFKAIFDWVSQQMSQHYTPEQIASYKVVRFDSTLVALSSKLLKTQGIRNGVNRSKSKDSDKLEIKFTVGFDGLNVNNALFFNQQEDLSEDNALGEIIRNTSLSSKDIAVFDRGLAKRKTYDEFSEHHIQFVTRLKNGTKNGPKHLKVNCITKIEPPEFICTDTLQIHQDDEVYLYDAASQKTKQTFRMIVADSLHTGQKMYFLTNMFGLSAAEVTEVYKQRWKIEVFFKFLKQEMNFKHFLSRNENGIQAVLYTTLITAMLIYIYRQVNRIEGYKMAKLVFINDLEADFLETIIELCQGNPKLLATLNSC